MREAVVASLQVGPKWPLPAGFILCFGLACWASGSDSIWLYRLGHSRHGHFHLSRLSAAHSGGSQLLHWTTLKSGWEAHTVSSWCFPPTSSPAKKMNHWGSSLPSSTPSLQLTEARTLILAAALWETLSQNLSASLKLLLNDLPTGTMTLYTLAVLSPLVLGWCSRQP